MSQPHSRYIIQPSPGLRHNYIFIPSAVSSAALPSMTSLGCGILSRVCRPGDASGVGLEQGHAGEGHAQGWEHGRKEASL